MTKLKTLKDLENEVVVIGEPDPRARPMELPVHSSALRYIAKEWIEKISDEEQYRKMPFAEDFEISCEQTVLTGFIKYFFNLEEE
jgi:hypothetical protein